MSKNKMKKVIVIIASIVVQLVVVGCSVQRTVFHKEDISYLDGVETFDSNPARGAATRGPWLIFQPEGLPDWHGEPGFHSSLWDLSRFSGGRVQDGKRPAPNRVGTADISLTEAMKNDVRRFLEETRSLGGSLIVRLGYTWTDEKGCEPSNFDLILEHVKELSKIMSDYDDVIVGVEAGVIGPWGEMHSSDYEQSCYAIPILQTYLDNLSSKISILVRRPLYMEMIGGYSSRELLDAIPFSNTSLQRMGIFNDGYIGTQNDWGTWLGEYTREAACQLLKTMDDHPYGGEIAHCDRQHLDANNEIFQPTKWNLVKELYETHLSYLRNINAKNHTIAEYLNNELIFDTLSYRFDGMPKLAEYQGESMGKLMTDHMGYRFVVRDLCMPRCLKAGKEAEITILIENTGFGKLLLPSKVELVLAVGNLTANIPVECRLDMKGGEERQSTLHFVVPDSVPKGECQLFLRAWAPLKGEIHDRDLPLRPIRFANEEMWNENMKANNLGHIITK